MTDAIINLRQQGASPRFIRELLATVDVAVSTATIARFLAEVATIERLYDSVSDSLVYPVLFRTRFAFNMPPFRERPPR